MVFKSLCIVVLLTKVASVLVGYKEDLGFDDGPLLIIANAFNINPNPQ